MKIFVFALALAGSIASGQELPSRLTLADAIRFAERNSPVLKAARADADAASAGAWAGAAKAAPQLSANAFATGGNDAGIIGSSPMVEPLAWMAAPTGSFVDGNLMLMVPLVVPGLHAMASSAGWRARAAAGDLTEANADLDLQVVDAYERVLLARQMVLAEQAKVDAAQELFRTTKALVDAGKGIDASVQRTQAELARAQRALLSAQNNEAKARLDLLGVMGGDLESAADPSDSLVALPVERALEDWIARAKVARGVLLAAHARFEAAGEDIRSAEGERMPQLYGVAMGDATNRHGMGGLTAGLTLSFPLYDGGRIRAEVAQARAARTRAEAQLRQAELNVEKEVRQAWLDLRSAAANIASAEAGVSAAQSAYDVIALRVSAGKSILVEQLDALEALTLAKADLAQATFDQVLATARLNRAAGGKQ